MPAIYGASLSVRDGGLISYGTTALELDRQVPRQVDKILRGAKPADIPVEQPMEFELVLNLKTARALGLSVPQPMLLRANQVIE